MVEGGHERSIRGWALGSFSTRPFAKPHLQYFPSLRDCFLLIRGRSLGEGIGMKIRTSTIFIPISSLAELLKYKKAINFYAIY